MTGPRHHPACRCIVHQHTPSASIHRVRAKYQTAPWRSDCFKKLWRSTACTKPSELWSHSKNTVDVNSEAWWTAQFHLSQGCWVWASRTGNLLTAVTSECRDLAVHGKAIKSIYTWPFERLCSCRVARFLACLSLFYFGVCGVGSLEAMLPYMVCALSPVFHENKALSVIVVAWSWQPRGAW